MAARLIRTWEGEDELSGSDLAIALQAASRAVAEERGGESVEVVWTGPRTTAVPVRLTREVLIDVIRASRKSLFIVSFAAYKVEVVLKELAAAAGRGVAVRLILESGETEGGTLTFDAAKAFDALGDGVTFCVWPTEKRPVLERGRASLHAKAAIADDDTALVTSANLTGHARHLGEHGARPASTRGTDPASTLGALPPVDCGWDIGRDLAVTSRASKPRVS